MLEPVEFTLLVEQDQSPDALVQEFVQKLGLISLAELDVLVFLYKHQSILASAEQIARLLGYPGEAVDGALEKLESQKLVQRSRPSRGVHFFKLLSDTQLSPSHRLSQLVRLADDRAGRLLLYKHLRSSA
jgi:predicted ArsR family transcriptional regulator